jgi:hypothetical protein
MKELRIIQMSVLPKENHNQVQIGFLRTALCEDGSMWEFDTQQNRWFALPTIKIKENQQ